MIWASPRFGHPHSQNLVIWASPVTLTLTQKCKAFDKSLVCSRRHGCNKRSRRWEVDSFSCEYCVKSFYCFELLAGMSLRCETGIGIHRIAFSLILIRNFLNQVKKKTKKPAKTKVDNNSKNNHLEQNFRPNIQIKLKTNKSFLPQLKSAPTPAGSEVYKTQFQNFAHSLNLLDRWIYTSKKNINNNNNSHNSTRYKKILKLHTFAAVQFHSQTYVSVPR